MNIKIEYKTITGRRHVYEGEKNQDIVKVLDTGEITVISINDGCSGCDYPINAGETNAAVAEKIAKNPVIWTMKEAKFFKYIAGEYNRALCETGLPYDELCSTTAFVIINKRSGVFIAFSIGDCGILSYSSDLHVTSLLKPQNGLRKSNTFFTNCDEFLMKKVAQYHKGILTDSGIAGFILYSDGAESIAVPPYDTAQQLVCAGILPHKTSENHLDNLFTHLTDICSDDISIAVVSNVTDKTEQAARATYNGSIIEDEYVKTEDMTDSAAKETPSETFPYEHPEHTKTDTKVFNNNDDSKKDTKVFSSTNDKTDTKRYDKEDKLQQKAAPTSHHNDKKSELLAFLETPRTMNDILNSGLVDETKILYTLLPLIKAGIIICNEDNIFSAQ